MREQSKRSESGYCLSEKSYSYEKSYSHQFFNVTCTSAAKANAQITVSATTTSENHAARGFEGVFRIYRD
jgi:hypothetical protein